MLLLQTDDNHWVMKSVLLLFFKFIFDNDERLLSKVVTNIKKKYEI